MGNLRGCGASRWRRVEPRVTPGLVAVLIASALAGCDTFKSDFTSFTESFSPPSPVQAAEWALDPYDAENRRRGTTLLAAAPWGGSDPYIRMYRDRIATETNPQVLSISIRALSRHGFVEDARPIAEKLTYDNRSVRWEAAKGLQRIHDPGVIEPLAARVADANEDLDVRMAAATALGQYATDRSFQALVLALDARELGINDAASQSLQLVTGKDFGIDRSAWLTWYRAEAAPFAGQQPFLFPTYRRRLTLSDRLVFWAPLTFEEPGPPTGLPGTGTRSTYEPRAGGTNGSGDSSAPPTDGAASGTN